MLFFNTLAVFVLVVAKFPNMHKVRIFGINGDLWFLKEQGWLQFSWSSLYWQSNLMVYPCWCWHWKQYYFLNELKLSPVLHSLGCILNWLGYCPIHYFLVIYLNSSAAFIVLHFYVPFYYPMIIRSKSHLEDFWWAMHMQLQNVMYIIQLHRYLHPESALFKSVWHYRVESLGACFVLL